MRKADSGFTLMEMLVVLALLAVVAGIALPVARRQNDGVALRATAHQLAAHMRTARGAAIRDSAEKTLVLDAGGRRYWVEGVTKVQALAKGVELRVAGALRFYPDGTSTGGTVVLAGGGSAAEITLDTLTGTPRLQWSR